MTSRDRLRIATVGILALAVFLGGPRAGHAEPENLECSPCATNTGGWITHDWTPACCMMDSPGCYMYPDAQQTGNGGSCQGMHRPCTSD
jgi:hypothetical protein